MSESVTRQNMKLSPRIYTRNPVNGHVEIQVPKEIGTFLVQLLNTYGKRSDYFATCITCLHWKDNQCSLVRSVPPPEVIANGCPSYEDSSIVPF